LIALKNSAAYVGEATAIRIELIWHDGAINKRASRVYIAAE